MSTTHLLLCHTCKIKIDLHGYNREFIQEFAGHCALYSHCGHTIQVLSDASLGWDEEYTKEYYKYDGGYTNITVQEDIENDKNSRGRDSISLDGIRSPEYVSVVLQDNDCWIINSDGQSHDHNGRFYNVVTGDCEGDVSLKLGGMIDQVYHSVWGNKNKL
jgi:hypothetical protein